jgi:hypothetical protein
MPIAYKSLVFIALFWLDASKVPVLLVLSRPVLSPALSPPSRVDSVQGEITARLVVAGWATTCSQKIHNQLVSKIATIAYLA